MTAPVLYITEFAMLGFDPNGPAAVPEQPELAKQTITTSASSQQSSAFQAATRYVRLHIDTNGPCCYEFGTNPTATVTSARMAPNQTEYHGVPRGSGFMVAVIQATA
jgi:hypothetical protein